MTASRGNISQWLLILNIKKKKRVIQCLFLEILRHILSISPPVYLTHIQPSHNTQEEKSLQSDMFPRKQLPTLLLVGIFLFSIFFWGAALTLFLLQKGENHFHHFFFYHAVSLTALKYIVLHLQKTERESGGRKEIFHASTARRP